MIWRTFTVLSLLLVSSRAAAKFEFDLLKSTTDTSAVQWTLGDQLAGNTQIALADTWFTNHHPVRWIEVTPSTNFRHYRQTTKYLWGTSTTLNHEAQDYTLEIDLLMLAFEGFYEDTDNSEETFSGSIGLRLLGLTSQSTSVTGRFGWRKQQDLSTSEAWVNQYLEADLQLYLARWAGLTSKYRYYFPHLSNQGTRRQGTYLSGGAFLEFGILRIIADLTQEPGETSRLYGDPVREVRTGVDAGIRLAF